MRTGCNCKSGHCRNSVINLHALPKKTPPCCLQVVRDAVASVEQDGIVFLDEIDKIVVNQDTRYGGRALPALLCLRICNPTLTPDQLVLVPANTTRHLYVFLDLLSRARALPSCAFLTLCACAYLDAHSHITLMPALALVSFLLAFCHCSARSPHLASSRSGADASSEGVQRDLLPIIEGSVVSTKYGNVNTDHILFICSGAFHSCKPSDMLAELQGRLPIRVELKGLTCALLLEGCCVLVRPGVARMCFSHQGNRCTQAHNQMHSCPALRNSLCLLSALLPLPSLSLSLRLRPSLPLSLSLMHACTNHHAFAHASTHLHLRACLPAAPSWVMPAHASPITFPQLKVRCLGHSQGPTAAIPLMPTCATELQTSTAS